MTRGFYIAERRIGPEAPTFIIAEAGSNHDGSLKQAKELVDIAADAGADAVKFQLFKAEVLAPEDAEIQEILSDVELPRDWLGDLAEHAQRRDIMLLASPFDAEAVDALVDIGSPALKIASSEITNHRLLQHAASTDLPMIISTAMSDLADVTEAMTVVQAAGDPDVALLQCTAVYPLDAKDVNLRAMDTLSQAFDVPVGFSDHTMGTWAPVAAVARGARIIEKHITLDRTLEGPDHGYALEPEELTGMVDAIRRTEEALGTSAKTMLPGEAQTARREGVFARRSLDEGEVLAKEDLKAGRPPKSAIPVRYEEAILGRRLTADLAEDQPITWEHIGDVDDETPSEENL